MHRTYIIHLLANRIESNESNNNININNNNNNNF